ncbi:MAG TPA: ergothioneine biosynthesis protein EgtB [Blastocatellia bacterium]|nr:ergothioneine biosynthesis protein EgtB [Blastocatellia bacterium]
MQEAAHQELKASLGMKHGEVTEVGPDSPVEDWIAEYDLVRQRTMRIVEPLEIEDYVVQTAPFMSPPRWHLGHTTWFFEIVLRDYLPGYRMFSEDYLYYFNSYYEKFGSRLDKGLRGTRSRPTVKETTSYRQRVDDNMHVLLGSLGTGPERLEVARLVRLGLEHEMQHQELLVYDIKHLLGDVYIPRDRGALPVGRGITGMARIEGGLFELGHDGQGFAYDNEKPAHLVYLQDYLIDLAPVSNGEFLEFMMAGGYKDYRYWYSEAWSLINQQGWLAPMYWENDRDQWMIRDFHGLHPVAEMSDHPVCHVSFHEASAYARWKGKRLPTEAEWEKAACFDEAKKSRKRFPWGGTAPEDSSANLFESSFWSTAPIGSITGGRSLYGCEQMIGDVWEWTSSDYVPYPGFRSEFDEYNDKWFIGQKVLRGGSYATPRSHIRSTYRNFFAPAERWMIAGFRCAKTYRPNGL